MPIVKTKGAASSQGFGEFAQASTVANYIEDVFSTYLYTGNGTSQSIVNGIDVSTYGGMTWIKNRSTDTGLSVVHDTARGTTQRLSTNLTDAQVNLTGGIGLTAFNSNGFTVGTGTAYNGSSANTYASWTFRKQPKFFDVVTYTGNGTSGRQIAHNLGSTPGCIIVKCTSTATVWAVYHRSLGGTNYLRLNTTDASVANSTFWNNTDPTSTVFTVGNAQGTNQNTLTYVAYLFAHDAGGFGLTGTDNVISCGSYVGNGSTNGPEINLGYEAQFVMIKAAENVRTSPTSYNNWAMVDVMRGMPNPSSGTGYALGANLSDAENGGYLAAGSTVYPTATGFKINSGESMYNYNGCTYIYIAIRRGPMKVPTSGTSVFAPVTQTGNTLVTTNFPVDLVIDGIRNSASGSDVTDRLRGSSTNLYNILNPYSTSAETTGSGGGFGLDNNNGYQISGFFGGTTQTVMWNFRRAPSFFDEVCYTGDGTTPGAFNHNLGVVPEMVIVKSRSLATQDWRVWAVTYSGGGLSLNKTAAKSVGGFGGAGSIPANSTTFYVSPSATPNNMNSSGATYVAYLFATCAGVSKVGSYTGNGSTQTINCGFTGGARFVLIKRTDAAGDWYVYDTARGMTTLTDPYLLLNSTAAESATLGSVTTVSTGFAVDASILAAVNTNAASYIFLAVA